MTLPIMQFAVIRPTELQIFHTLYCLNISVILVQYKAILTGKYFPTLNLLPSFSESSKFHFLDFWNRQDGDGKPVRSVRNCLLIDAMSYHKGLVFSSTLL
jgi:hypothetical protein